MGRLNLHESQHAPLERSAYIPPHLRGQQRGPGPAPPMDGPAPMNGGGPGLQNSAWGPAGSVWMIHNVRQRR
jgi:ATP-dependent RNA helicase DDX3X